tara:strand:- start:423 stop:764 length:342 start_codon:yes stop_codon:yes gene_type:complete
MIWNKYIVYSILLSVLGNLIVWFQLNGQLKWDFMRNNMILVCLVGMPVSYIFFKVTEFAYLGLGSLWGVRFLVYACSYLVFPFLTYWVLGESLTIKTLISIILSLIILLIQLI